MTKGPLFLLADSRPLFAETGIRLALRRALEPQAPRGVGPRAAYLGASNGDLPEFYDLFVAAMTRIGILDTRHIRAHPSADRGYLDDAQLVLLAGGEVVRGFCALESTGLADAVAARHAAGAVVLGVSAGAVQLGTHGGDPRGGAPLVPMLGLVPAVIDVHDEPGWARLRAILVASPHSTRGLAIPSSAAVLVPSGDAPWQAVGRPATRFRFGESAWTEELVPATDS